MSTDQYNHLSANNNKYAKAESLPPRSLKHGRRRPESDREEQEPDIRAKSFPFIQVLMWSLLSIILCMIVFGLWQHAKENPKAETQAEENDNQQEPTEDENEVADKSSGDSDNTIIDTVTGVETEDGKEENEDSSEVGDEQQNQQSEQEDNPTTVSNNHQEKEANNNENASDPSTTGEGQGENVQPKVIAVHIVQPGETFYRITMTYYNSRAYEDYLAEFNGIKDKTDIKAGMKIKIPEVR